MWFDSSSLFWYWWTIIHQNLRASSCNNIDYSSKLKFLLPFAKIEKKTNKWNECQIKHFFCFFIFEVKYLCIVVLYKLHKIKILPIWHNNKSLHTNHHSQSSSNQSNKGIFMMTKILTGHIKHLESLWSIFNKSNRSYIASTTPLFRSSQQKWWNILRII